MVLQERWRHEEEEAFRSSRNWVREWV